MQCKCGGQTRVKEETDQWIYTCKSCSRRYYRKIISHRDKKGGQYSFLSEPEEQNERSDFGVKPDHPELFIFGEIDDA